MNIALHIRQLFLQNQLPCSLAVSVLLDIVIHVLVTYLVFWDYFHISIAINLLFQASLEN